MGVSDISATQAALEAKRALPRTLMEGTEAMRAAGKLYLPQHPAESLDAWECRRQSSTLLPGYRDAVELVCGLIFRKPVQHGANVPEDAQEWLSNIDQAGQSISQFCESVEREALVDGISYMIAMYPPVPQGATLAQENVLGARPYLVHVKAKQVLSWRTQLVNGRQKLTQFIYQETTTVPDGQFGTKEEQVVRVFDPGMLTVYKKVDGKWVMDADDSAMLTLRDEIPVVPVYTGRKGFLLGEPPLLDLAWKNVEHWQSASDQRNILHVARVPLLALIGVTEDPNIVLSSTNYIKIPFDGDAKWIEHSGKAIEAGRQDLQDLETQMQRMAGKILDSGIAKTATQSDQESVQAKSKVQAWAIGLQSTLNLAWGLCGKWIGRDLGTLSVNTDVDLSKPDAQLLTEIRNAVIAGLLSKQTYLEILQNAEVLPEGFSIEEEMERLNAQGPTLLDDNA